MTKKILIVLLSLLALTACSGHKAPKIDFEGPIGGPDLKKIMPTYGPNDPVPPSAAPAEPLANPVEPAAKP